MEKAPWAAGGVFQPECRTWMPLSEKNIRTPQNHVGIFSFNAGWWFGTWLLFFQIWGMSSSQLTFIFFRGVGQPPTRNSRTPPCVLHCWTPHVVLMPICWSLNPHICRLNPWCPLMSPAQLPIQNGAPELAKLVHNSSNCWDYFWIV